MPGTRKLGRASDHRRAMLRGMVTFLLENGRVETTITRAKEVRAMAEKMITTAKTNTLHSKREVLRYVTKEDVVKKLFDEIAPKYAEVKGGYTRIVRTRARRGDAAEMAIIELMPVKPDEKPEAEVTAKKSAKKAPAKKAAPKAKKEEVNLDEAETEPKKAEEKTEKKAE